jgi:DNA-binding protein HU-beta
VPNKAQFVELLAERLDGDKRRAQEALNAMIDTVYHAVSRGEKVVLTGFGVFEKRDRAARMARNPATGASVKVKKTSVPAFRPGAEFKAITSGAKKLAKAPAKRVASIKSAAAKTLAKAPGTKASAAKAPATKASAAKAPAAAPAAKAPAKKAATKAVTKAAPTKAAPASKAPATKAPASKATATKATAAKATKAPATKAAAKKAAKVAAPK